MERREFLERSLAGGALLGSAAPQAQQDIPREPVAGGTAGTSYEMETVVERKRDGQPHAGKVLAAIQPHCDDIAIFAGGTVLKLIDEGYRGILINLTDDSMAGTGSSIGDIVLKNEHDTREVARRMGLEDVFFLNYPNHNIDGWPLLEMRARLTVATVSAGRARGDVCQGPGGSPGRSRARGPRCRRSGSRGILQGPRAVCCGQRE